MSRNTYVEYERTAIIGRTSIDKRDSNEARRWNQTVDAELKTRRKEWVFIPPSAMVIQLHRNDLILCVPQTVGRTLLRRRDCSIIERDYVAVDAVLEGEHEQVLEEFGIGQVAA